MSTYTICVELHGRPSPLELQLLRERLAEAGFFQQVDGITQVDGDIVGINLPRSVFLGEFQASSVEIAESVYAIAGKIRSVACVFVAETSKWSLKQ